ncbi:hypothetical protein [Catellatospora sp. NPDC049609]|uniref:hypothetical protein n=1 Tax=Catellatospora sp. NPDC049609 TaxID=3155505 RepID=UPI00342A96A7
MIAPSPVTRSSLPGKVLPILVPTPMTELPTRIWSDEQWEQIKLGWKSRNMDEKWDVFVEGQTVFLHRSWTGFGLYEASFSPVAGGGWRISAAVVETHPSRHGRSPDGYHGQTLDAHDRLTLEIVLRADVLGEGGRRPVR